MINTGNEFIPANTPIYWDAPEERDSKLPIKGMPEGAIYPEIKPYTQDNMAAALAEGLIAYNGKGAQASAANTAFTALGTGYGEDEKRAVKEILSKIIGEKMSMWRRVIGWTLNDSEQGHQMDVILKR